jgi:hypothetical protein
VPHFIAKAVALRPRAYFSNHFRLNIIARETGISNQDLALCVLAFCSRVVLPKSFYL